MRLKITSLIFSLFFLAILSKLFYWQVVKGSELKKEASYQYKGTKKITASRGNIYANDGTWLAVMRTNWLLFAEKPKISNPRIIANSLEDILEEDSDSIYAKLTRDGVVWLPIKHKITTEQKEKIEDLNILGLGFEPEETRYYPEGSASAQLLGFVGKNDEGDDIGYFGLEGYYNIPLSGKDGFLQREKDLSGTPLLSSGISEINSITGTDLYTYIDKRIQNSVEEKLKEGMEKYGAKEGSVVVMDPKTGAILAMSSYPSYDPARYNEYDQLSYKNPAISDTFEPGSVFKVLVMAAGLDTKVIEPDTICDICDKPFKVDKYFIETWDKKYRPDSTMTDVLVHSDNVGMSFIAQRLGSDTMYDYLDKFGIGKLTEIDLQGESNIKLRKKGTWNIVDLATSSFGQGVSVTPIQFIRAVSAIANNGYLALPKVVNTGEKNKAIQIISKEAADQTTSMMIESAKRGESQWTDLKGFSVAGKTGTAQIPIAGHYDADKTIASFVGFAPANKPKFVMLVTLKEPQSSQWASETAAPLWYSIAKDLFNHFGIQPE
ncbi:MAG: penicillin-binding protein 2, partial [Candidatus Woesebacteria bacterium]|nr:penicillin-binding protein 2 [Candidatus Woesebacteria bacterium]